MFVCFLFRSLQTLSLPRKDIGRREQRKIISNNIYRAQHASKNTRHALKDATFFTLGAEEEKAAKQLLTVKFLCD